MSIIGALPFNFTNGTTADATQVDANFQTVLDGVNTNAVPLVGDSTITGNLTTTGDITSGGNITSGSAGLITGFGGKFNSVTATLGITSQTLTVTGAFTPQSGIVGVANGGNAAAGDVGEYEAVNSLLGPFPLTSTIPANITSRTLTAGDWDVEGVVFFNVTVGSAGALFSAISGTSATLPADGSSGKASIGSSAASLANTCLPTGTLRVPLGSTTTIYLIGQANFGGGSAVQASGTLRARRVR